MPVAVRSSATAEDTAEASFAGQQDTYLWVRGAEAVAGHVSRCWASLFTDRAVAYRARLGIGDDEVAMGVVVQAMVPAEAAGVLLTLDPLTGDRSQVTIEAAYGLGTAVVEGEVTPDRFAVDKVTLELRSRSVGEKAVAYRFDPAAGRVARVEVPAADRARPCLDDAEVAELAGLGKRIEQALGVPQDVEWAWPPRGGGRARAVAAPGPAGDGVEPPAPPGRCPPRDLGHGPDARLPGPPRRTRPGRARLNGRRRRQGGPARRGRGPAPHPVGAAGGLRGPQRLAARDPALAGPARPGHRPAVALGPGRRADLRPATSTGGRPRSARCSAGP